MRIILFVFLAVLILGCSNKKEISAIDKQYIALEHKILNVDFKYKSTWSPPTSDIVQVKLAISKYLNSESMRGNIHVENINSNLNIYGFQFVGFGSGSDKKIWCNFIPKALSEKWDTEIIKSEEFGSIRIEIEYSVVDDKCHSFSVIKPT
ncbi:MAG: hypothetical protein KKB34_18660 [Bacteroidetes bacterium]|nr:hypothetical protein [Bacteroidota bacterium]